MKLNLRALEKPSGIVDLVSKAYAGRKAAERLDAAVALAAGQWPSPTAPSEPPSKPSATTATSTAIAALLSLIGGRTTISNSYWIWTQTSDDSYKYQLSLVVAIASIS